MGPEVSVGLQITQQPKERLFWKISDLSQPTTDGPLGLRSHLCKMMLTKHTPSCLYSSKIEQVNVSSIY